MVIVATTVWIDYLRGLHNKTRRPTVLIASLVDSASD
jgi:hypothetical protein